LLAAEEINAAGGIPGVGMIEIYSEDDEGKPDVSVSAVQKLVHRDNVHAVLGAINSSATNANMKVTWDAEIPQITAISSAPTITAQGNPWIFRTQITSERTSQGLAEVGVNDLGITKWGILHDADDYGRDAANIFEKRLAELGIKDIPVEIFIRGDKDYTGQLLNLSRAGVEGVGGFGMNEEIARAIKQAKEELDLHFQWIGTDAIGVDDFPLLAGEAAEDTIVSVLFVASNPDLEVQQFVKKIQDKYGETPDYACAQGYDAMMLLADAIERAGTTNNVAIRDALRATSDFVGLTGKTKFDENGNDLKPFLTTVWKNGILVPYN